MEGLRVLGDPADFVRYYYENDADELILIDVGASLYQMVNQKQVMELAAEAAFIPVTVGGGIRSCQDIHDLLLAGADKIAINTAAIHNPSLITEAAKQFGSQCITTYVESKARSWGSECLTDNARETTGLDVLEWCRQAVELGAGEILLHSVDQDGTGRGYDLELTRAVSESVSVPVIASGGAGRPEHLVEAVLEGKADAVAAASLFHFEALESLRANSSLTEGNTEFLSGRRGGPRFSGSSIQDVKRVLEALGVQVRNSPGW